MTNRESGKDYKDYEIKQHIFKKGNSHTTVYWDM